MISRAEDKLASKTDTQVMGGDCAVFSWHDRNSCPSPILLARGDGHGKPIWRPQLPPTAGGLGPGRSPRSRHRMRTGRDRRVAPLSDTGSTPALSLLRSRPDHWLLQSRHPAIVESALHTSDGRLIGRPMIEPGTQPLPRPADARGTLLLRVGADALRLPSLR